MLTFFHITIFLNILIRTFQQSVFTFLAELEDPDHIKPAPPVVDKNGLSIDSTASMSDTSHHSLAISMSSETQRKNKATPIYAFTATVGKKESHALQYVDDAIDVATLLKKLANYDN